MFWWSTKTNQVFFSVSFYTNHHFIPELSTDWNLKNYSVKRRDKFNLALKNLLLNKTAWDQGATYCTGLAASSLLFYKNLFYKWRGKLDKSNNEYGHTMKTLKNKLDLNLVYVKSLQLKKKNLVLRIHQASLLFSFDSLLFVILLHNPLCSFGMANLFISCFPALLLTCIGLIIVILLPRPFF